MQELSKFPSSYEASVFEPLIDESEIQNIVQTLANTISQRFNGEELILIELNDSSLVYKRIYNEFHYQIDKYQKADGNEW